MTTAYPETLATWQEKAAWAQDFRDRTVAKVEPPLTGIPVELPLSSQGLPALALTEREIEITERYKVDELLAVMRQRKISVEEVTRAFLRRAALAQTATNCLTELRWDQAIARARYLDGLPEPKGALFGLPISTKEHHGAPGDDITANGSYVTWINKRHHGPIMIYETFWNQGAVFYARTTQPQTIMHLETNSNVYGRTVNPHNRNLTPGGSSGGESALLGIRGSIFGVGGDIGGSIRCPAAHCGVYGFKPSTKRLPVGGQCLPMAGKEAVTSTLGPMAVDRRSLEIFMQVALSTKPWRLDPSLLPKAWTPYKFNRPLKIAVQWWDGVVKPHPPMLRALRIVVEACKKAGMTVVDWDCTSLDHKRGWEILSSLYWPDGGSHVVNLLERSGEPILPLTRFIIHEQPSVRNLSQEELWARCRERDQYRERYAAAWTATGAEDGQEVDVILCPPSFGAATPHDQSRYWGYTAHWNLLDCPGAVFPVTKVDPALDVKEVGYVPKNKEDQFVYDMYSPEKYVGAPVGLQVVGRRHYDEKVLAALGEIERALGRD